MGEIRKAYHIDAIAWIINNLGGKRLRYNI